MVHCGVPDQLRQLVREVGDVVVAVNFGVPVVVEAEGGPAQLFDDAGTRVWPDRVPPAEPVALKLWKGGKKLI